MSSSRALACLAAVVTALSSPAIARGEDSPRRRVAVLEFRGGSAAVPNIGRRSAQLLRDKTSLAVVDIDDARGAAGSKIDARVAECAGDAACLAQLGGALKVEEILLLGVSEFGDVILTLQRIDVKTGDVVSRVAEALAPGANPDDAKLLDYLRRVMPRADFLRFGTIRIEANVAGAEVTIGNKSRGTTPVDPLRVRAPATYDIALDKPGYTEFRATVQVPADAVIDVKPVLSPKSEAWYANWWVATIAGTVVVGAVTTAVVLTQEDPTEFPVVVDWDREPPDGAMTLRF